MLISLIAGAVDHMQKWFDCYDGPIDFSVHDVNIAAEETDLQHASDDEMNSFFAHVGLSPAQVKKVVVSENIDAAILESRFGVELWKYFIGLALLFAVAEMALGRESKDAS